jgi:hypothetical protein
LTAYATKILDELEGKKWLNNQNSTKWVWKKSKSI